MKTKKKLLIWYHFTGNFIAAELMGGYYFRLLWDSHLSLILESLQCTHTADWCSYLSI